MAWNSWCWSSCITMCQCRSICCYCCCALCVWHAWIQLGRWLRNWIVCTKFNGFIRHAFTAECISNIRSLFSYVRRRIVVIRCIVCVALFDDFVHVHRWLLAIDFVFGFFGYAIGVGCTLSFQFRIWRGCCRRRRHRRRCRRCRWCHFDYCRQANFIDFTITVIVLNTIIRVERWWRWLRRQTNHTTFIRNYSWCSQCAIATATAAAVIGADCLWRIFCIDRLSFWSCNRLGFRVTSVA